MWARSAALYAICIGYAAVGGAHPMEALTIEECSAKYRAANAETGRIITWEQFRKDNCEVCTARRSATAAPKANPSMGFNPGSVFPQAISPKYANEPARRARMHTCLDQYRANKKTNGNGSLRWNTKHGGYYSECNRRLRD